MTPHSIVDVRSEIREFLASRRALVSPSTVGIPDLNQPRRVPGLRREEVAVLAGISAPYYARLERGDLVNASLEVVDAIGAALRLDSSERSYLTDLASWNRRRLHRRDADASPSSVDRSQVPSTLVDLLEALTGAAGFIFNDREEVLVANQLGYAVATPMFTTGRDPNFARWVFLDPDAPRLFGDSWASAASKASSTLRTALGRYPGDQQLITLIDELSSRSEQFRRFWETRDVAVRTPEHMRYLHPVVGPIDLDVERFVVPYDPRLVLLTLGAPPGTRSATSLATLRDRAAQGGVNGD